MNQSELFLPSLNFQRKPLIEPHRHGEGASHLDFIFDAAEDVGSPLRTETKAVIKKQYQNIVDQNAASLDNYISLLPTRYIRLVVVKIMNALYEQPELANNRICRFLTILHQKGLRHAKIREKIDGINWIVSPANMATDGDLSLDKIHNFLSRIELLEEEREELQQLQKKLIEKPNSEVGLKMIDYVALLGYIRKTAQVKPELTILTTSLRRNTDLRLITSPEQYEPFVNQIFILFVLGLVDSLDISGPETTLDPLNPTEPLYPISMAIPLLSLATQHHLPYTVHIGEVPFRNPGQVGYKNLRSIITAVTKKTLQHGPTWFAHSLRAFDLTQASTAFRELMIQLRINVALNVSSNEKTRTVKPINHPILRFASRFPEIYELLPSLEATDNPTTTSIMPTRSLPHERQLVSETYKQIARSRENKLSVNDFLALQEKHSETAVARTVKQINELRQQAIRLASQNKFQQQVELAIQRYAKMFGFMTLKSANTSQEDETHPSRLIVITSSKYAATSS